MKKLNFLLKVTLVFLFACVISFNLVVDRAMATGDFSQSCADIKLDGSSLSAECRKINGAYENTTINLDDYIGNLDGTLSWGDHLFSRTCKEIYLGQLLSNREYVINAKCEKRDGYTYEPTEINLDDHIANIDGVLEYE